MKRVFITAGDPSGDLVASQLIESMRKMDDDLFVVGVGGENIKRVSNQFLENIVGQHALGFALTPKKIFYFRRVLNDIIAPELEKNPPDAVIPVDFYGFNSRVAQMAKSMGHKVFYYVSPQFWASRPGRADRLRVSVDLFLCLFPFEVAFYKDRNMPVQFVGHPILDRIPPISIETLYAPRIETTIGLLPGSRPEEIKRHLPIMADACGLISKEAPNTRYILFTVPHVSRHLYQEILRQSNHKLLIDLVQDENYQWRGQLDLAMTASGMETLENALLGIPMVVMYKMDWITYVVARAIVNIPHVAMPNLLAGKELVPEFIQYKATAHAVAAPLLKWLKDPTARKAMRKDLLLLREKMGTQGASDRAARTILEKVA